MNSFGYYVVLGVLWILAAGFQLSTVRMLPSSMRGFKLFGVFSSVLNLGLAIFLFTMAYRVGL
jgi:hypothetical protein